MAVNYGALKALAGTLDNASLVRLTKSAEEIDRIDAKFRALLDKTFNDAIEDTSNAIIEGRKLPEMDQKAIESVLLEHMAATMAAGIREASSSNAQPATARDASSPSTLAAPPATKSDKLEIPTTMKELRELYDKIRKGKAKLPAYIRRQAKKITALYLKRIAALHNEIVHDYDRGASISREDLIVKVRDAIKVSWDRAKMTLETESTRNYNQVRRAIYDSSPDVTHYLFVCVRDFATTKWCKSRDKLVYKKSDPLIDKETPPIHWNCRSEMLPLTKQNPVHAKLINDASRQRRAHKCEPLPKGWVSNRSLAA